jgi:hypothetical protein
MEKHHELHEHKKIEFQKESYLENIEIQKFLSELEKEIKEIKETQQSKVVETAPINNMNSQINRAKEAANTAKINMNTAEETFKKALRTYTTTRNQTYIKAFENANSNRKENR